GVVVGGDVGLEGLGVGELGEDVGELGDGGAGEVGDGVEGEGGRLGVGRVEEGLREGCWGVEMTRI
uniref:hypothetical protein n=1 Tax=Dermacoccus nishinomiyaensis TaxID=1274 RepID=UPI001C9319BA